MSNLNTDYDASNPESIEQYALQLKDMTFMEVLAAKGVSGEQVKAYANKLRKGGLGNLLEEVFFGYKANSKQEADFDEAGVELKASPYEKTKKGELRAGERLVLTMISYEGPIEVDFYKSHVWKKMARILLIYYWRNRQITNKLLYKISFIKLFTPPEEDLEIIKRDYAKIVATIQAGLAHELSESDTMYLGACTKGATAEKSTVLQYYGDKLPARKRAFCFKNSYMTYVLNHYVVGNEVERNAILDDVSVLKEKSFEEVLTDLVAKYAGKSDKELCNLFGREYNNNKAQWNDLVYRMLGVRGVHADEFEKANIKVKSFRIEEKSNAKESMSFPPFKFMDLVNENFEDSTLHNYFEDTRFFFVIWKRDHDVYRVRGCLLWNMPYDDLEVTVKREWEAYKRVIQYGVTFQKRVNKKGKISFTNNLPSKSDTEIIHIRPHSTKAAYRFNNGEEYGNVERDANILPNGEYMSTQSFWLNNDYVLRQLKPIIDEIQLDPDDEG